MERDIMKMLEHAHHYKSILFTTNDLIKKAITSGGGTMHLTGNRHVVISIEGHTIMLEGSLQDCIDYTEKQQHGHYAILAPVQIVTYEDTQIVHRRNTSGMDTGYTHVAGRTMPTITGNHPFAPVPAPAVDKRGRKIGKRAKGKK